MKRGLWGPHSRHCRGETHYLRQTFVGGPDLGTGRGCWRHAAVWAGTCFLSFQKVVSGAGHPSVLRHLSAKRTRVKRLWVDLRAVSKLLLLPLNGRKMLEQRNKDKERSAGSFIHSTFLKTPWEPNVDLGLSSKKSGQNFLPSWSAILMVGVGGRKGKELINNEICSW